MCADGWKCTFGGQTVYSSDMAVNQTECMAPSEGF